ncbi:MAG: hypothetical protein LJE70_01245 [Chromatiaceae bacterium]|nr:hypothetical protein [Chromatiaceae bacterium]
MLNFPGGFVNKRFFSLLSVLIGIAALGSGCGTTGPSVSGYDASKPRTLLAGADVQQAKSVAMGSAVSKGWRILDASDNRLVVTRPLDTTTAASVVGAPVSAALVEVRSDFYENQQGVDVVVHASLIADKGTKAERTIDFTDSYGSQLNYSLESLRRSWEANRWRIAAAEPPVPTKVAAPDYRETEPPAGAVAEGQTETLAAQSRPGEGVAVMPEPPAPIAAPVATPIAGDRAVPAEERYAVATPPPVVESKVAQTPAENMLALNRTADPGVWAYYAEHYAKMRGCDVSAEGAVLEQKQPEYEVHRVHCENGPGFLVSCNAGTCRGFTCSDGNCSGLE